MKAQAAMEYLMTYGWAILIVIIVAAALYSLGVFSSPVGTRATGFANIGVPQDWQYASAGTLNVVVRNGLGSAIDITTMTATCNNTAGEYNVVLTPNPPATTGLGSGLTRNYNTTAPLECDALAAGSSYSVKLKVIYTPQGSTYPKTDTGTLTGAAA